MTRSGCVFFGLAQPVTEKGLEGPDPSEDKAMVREREDNGQIKMEVKVETDTEDLRYSAGKTERTG